jgi:hypothetical protein
MPPPATSGEGNEQPGDSRPDLGGPDRAAQSEDRSRPPGEHGSEERTGSGSRDDEADRRRVEPDLARGIQHEQRIDHPAEEVVDGSSRHERGKRRRARDVGDSLADLLHGRPPLGVRDRRWLVGGDGGDERRREEERRRIEDQGERGAKELDEDPADSRARDRGPRARGLERGIRLGDGGPADERRHEGLVRHSEHDDDGSEDERDRIQELDPEEAEGRGDGHHDDRRRAEEVEADENPLPPHPIDPDPGGQPEDEIRQEPCRREQPHLR